MEEITRLKHKIPPSVEELSAFDSCQEKDHQFSLVMSYVPPVSRPYFQGQLGSTNWAWLGKNKKKKTWSWEGREGKVERVVMGGVEGSGMKISYILHRILR